MKVKACFMNGLKQKGLKRNQQKGLKLNEIRFYGILYYTPSCKLI